MSKSKLVVRDHDTGEVVSLSRSERRILSERIKDSNDPVRYIVVSELIPRKRYFYYIAHDNCYGMEIDQASQFKRRDIAEVICKALDKGVKKKHHLVVKITTRNKSIKVLKYFRND